MADRADGPDREVEGADATFCRDCINLHGSAKGIPGYRWICVAHPIEPRQRFTDGTWTDPYARCEPINNGACPDYTEGPNVLNPRTTDDQP